MNYFLLFIALFTVGFQNTFYSQEDENTALGINESQDVPDTNRVEDTFYSTRIINGHSTETLRKGVMEFRVEHRFGDIAGDAGGVQTMFGFDNSSDIRIALEYGVTRDLMVGFGRSKGTGVPYKSLLDGFVKYKILAQKKMGSPVTLSALTTTSFSYMKASSDISQVNAFPKWQHRLAYTAQLNIARKFNDRISLALIPTMVHRNYVATDDLNTLFSIGGAARFGINSKMAILLEYYQVLQGKDVRGTNTNSLGIAFEWITFGHNFTLNLTNSKGFGETQFIPYTYEKWSKGQFRLGFCIGRKFEKE